MKNHVKNLEADCSKKEKMLIQKEEEAKALRSKLKNLEEESALHESMIESNVEKMKSLEKENEDLSCEKKGTKKCLS